MVVVVALLRADECGCRVVATVDGVEYKLTATTGSSRELLINGVAVAVDEDEPMDEVVDEDGMSMVRDSLPNISRNRLVGGA